VAEDEVQKLAGNLSDLNKVSLDAGVQFKGLTKKLIEVSDATSKAGKKWTIFARLVSGSPLWRLQNKFRAFIDILGQVEQASQANIKAEREQQKRVIDSVQAYESLKEPLEKAIKLRKLGNLIGHTMERKHNKELKEAVKGTHAYNLARLQGVKVDKAVVKGLDEIIKKGKQQQKQFMVARKQAIFDKNMRTAKGREKISDDISKRIDDLNYGGFRKTISGDLGKATQKAQKAYIKAANDVSFLFEYMRTSGLKQTTTKIQDAIIKNEKLQKLRIKVMLMLLTFFGVIKPIFSYLFKVLIIFMVVMGAIMLLAKVAFDTFDLMNDLPFFMDLVKLVIGKIFDSLVLIFGLITALLTGDMYMFIEYGLELAENLLIIGLGLLVIALYGLVGVASGIVYSALDTVYKYFTGLLGGENAEFSKTVNKILFRALIFFSVLYFVKQLALVMLHVALTKGFYVMLIVGIGAAIIGGMKFLIKNFDIPFFASGGVSSGGMAVVGEGGPELVSLPAGARVHSNAQSKNMMKSNTVNNHVNVTINAKDTSDAELRRIADQVGNMITNKINRSTSSSGFVR